MRLRNVFSWQRKWGWSKEGKKGRRGRLYHLSILFLDQELVVIDDSLHRVQLISLDAVIQLQIRNVRLDQVVLSFLLLESFAWRKWNGQSRWKDLSVQRPQTRSTFHSLSVRVLFSTDLSLIERFLAVGFALSVALLPQQCQHTEEDLRFGHWERWFVSPVHISHSRQPERGVKKKGREISWHL